MLKIEIFRLSNWFGIVSSDVVNCDVTTRVTNGDQMGSLFTKLTASNTGVVINYFFREPGIFQSPEAQEARFQFAIVGAVNVKLAIANDN